MDENNLAQRSIYEDVFNQNKVDFDHWLLSPNEFLQEERFKWLKPVNGRSVLELGLGKSPFLGRVGSKYGLKCFGVDIAFNPLLAQTKNRPHPVFLAQSQCEHLPFRSESFDYVTANSVLEHASDLSGCTREILRILKPGGTCLLTVPCKDFKYSLLGKFKSYERIKFRRWFSEIKKTIGHDYEKIPTRLEWKDIMRRNGFEIFISSGSDIFIDALFMYHLYPGIGKAYYSTVKWLKRFLKGDCRSGTPCTPNRPFPISTPEAAAAAFPRVSLIRKFLGSLWIYLILNIFRLFIMPERLISRLPVGAIFNLCCRKPLRTNQP